MTAKRLQQLPTVQLGNVDILAALSFQAKRIAGTIDNYAAGGGAFPDPFMIADVLSRMTEFNDILVTLIEENKAKEGDVVN